MKNDKLIQIETKNGTLYYNETLNNFYIKEDLSFIIFNDKKVLYSKKVINQILEIKGIHLRSETCMYTGKSLTKVCIYTNRNGGVCTLKSSYNKRVINEFILEYKK